MEVSSFGRSIRSKSRVKSRRKTHPDREFINKTNNEGHKNGLQAR